MRVTSTLSERHEKRKGDVNLSDVVGRTQTRVDRVRMSELGPHLCVEPRIDFDQQTSVIPLELKPHRVGRPFAVLSTRLHEETIFLPKHACSVLLIDFFRNK